MLSQAFKGGFLIGFNIVEYLDLLGLFTVRTGRKLRIVSRNILS